MVLTGTGQQRAATLLRQRGAVVVEASLLPVVPGPHDARLQAATRRILRDPVDHVVVTSATGWARWCAAAASWGVADALLRQVRGARTLSLNTAVGAALREAGLRSEPSAPAGDYRAVTDWLLSRDPRCRRVAVVADEALPTRVTRRLRTRGIEVIVVPTHRLAPHGGRTRLGRLARWVMQREVHAVAFDTATAARALVDVTHRTGRGDLLRTALTTDVAVATGHAESAAVFLAWNVPVSWVPDGSAEALAGCLGEALVARRRQFRARGERFAVQGNAVLVNGATIGLQPRPAMVLRALADHPGQTLSRASIERLVWISPRAGRPAVELAVRRLREDLGDYSWLVVTDIGRGYRLWTD
ncbi:uroporphyrinogen-III synthase [Luedemannella flava]|uniref:Uroporphyrinogen-III synthase n=1 Tax=Luedemannella flava TaxID=349316 RepID=A0ABP4XPP6_9ACTN